MVFQEWVVPSVNLDSPESLVLSPPPVLQGLPSLLPCSVTWSLSIISCHDALWHVCAFAPIVPSVRNTYPLVCLASPHSFPLAQSSHHLAEAFFPPLSRFNYFLFWAPAASCIPSITFQIILCVTITTYMSLFAIQDVQWNQRLYLIYSVSLGN